VLDRLVIVIALAAVLIRTGNFVNSEIIGKPTGTESGVVFARDIEELIERSGGDLVADAEASASSRAGDAQPGEVPIKLLIKFERGVDESQAKDFLEKTVKRALLSRSADLEPHVSEPIGTPLSYSLKQERGTFTAVVNTGGITRHPAQLYEAINCVILFIILMLIWNKYREKSPEGLIFGIFLIQLFGFRFIDEFFKENQVAFEADIPLNMGQWLSIPLVIAGVLILLRLVVKRKTSDL
jgi:phosphatidylglycerol:prolipoprotein diacylglycerol transferase